MLEPEVERVGDGFQHFYREQFAQTARLARMLTGDPDVADDLAQYMRSQFGWDAVPMLEATLNENSPEKAGVFFVDERWLAQAMGAAVATGGVRQHVQMAMLCQRRDPTCSPPPSDLSGVGLRRRHSEGSVMGADDEQLDDTDDFDDTDVLDTNDNELDNGSDDIAESLLTGKQMANLRRSSRQAARFRITAKNERTRADAAEERANAALIELAFTRAAGQQFADLDAAWKLIDKTIIKIDGNGQVSGVDEAVEALLADHPFIAAADNSNDDKHPQDANPFRPTTSGSPMTGKRRPVASEPSAAKLAAKYPALRR